jgi:hypothetical protein
MGSGRKLLRGGKEDIWKMVFMYLFGVVRIAMFCRDFFNCSYG